MNIEEIVNLPIIPLFGVSLIIIGCLCISSKVKRTEINRNQTPLFVVKFIFTLDMLSLLYDGIFNRKIYRVESTIVLFGLFLAITPNIIQLYIQG